MNGVPEGEYHASYAFDPSDELRDLLRTEEAIQDQESLLEWRLRHRLAELDHLEMQSPSPEEADLVRQQAAAVHDALLQSEEIGDRHVQRSLDIAALLDSVPQGRVQGLVAEMDAVSRAARRFPPGANVVAPSVSYRTTARSPASAATKRKNRARGAR